MIAIKGMEMPKSCNECPMYNSDVDDYCDITGEWITGEEMVRHNDCPLVEIVTCKGCKYWDEPYCKLINNFTDDDYYCASAKRRE